MNLTLKGRTALITGGAGLVGFEIVKQFLMDGMNVGTVHSRQEKAWLTADWLRAYTDSFISLTRDDPDPAGKIFEKFGGIDVLVAGQGWPPLNQNIEDISLEYWISVVRSNLTGSFLFLQYAMPYLKKSPAPRVIFLVSSEALTGGSRDGLAYTAAKGGVIALMYSAARRLARYGITVNAVAMGGIYNKPFAVSGDDPEEILPDYSNMLDQIPLGRLGEPKDICTAVCYLASEEAAYVTGEVIKVDGGLNIS